MKIIKLEAENFKRLKAIEISPEGNTIVISGANTEGKTSVLDSIWVALGGREAAKGLKKPIREGEESAEVKVDLGDMIVTRKWTSDTKSYLTVENQAGAIFKSPQAILDNLIGNLSFDPLAFSHMTDKEQKETLLDLVNIDLDLDEWEEERQSEYDERTVVNRKVKELEGQLAGIPEAEEGLPSEEVSASTILEEISAAQLVKDGNDEKRREYSSMREVMQDLGLTKENLEGQISNLQQELEQTLTRIKNGRQVLADKNAEVTALVDPDMDSFQEKLKNIEKTNEAVRDKVKRTELETKVTETKAESEGLTKKIDDLDTKKSDAIEAAEFPIEHLGFDETGVTYKGIPFGQCSAAESLRVSLSIAIAINPKLRVLRITDGSLLDSKNMKIINEMVKDNDYQLWIEKVMDSPDGASVYIEDGEIRENV